MYRIKLLILLLVSLNFLSCASNKEVSKTQFSVAYIGGEYDGLLLSNKLKNFLNNFGMLNTNSNYEIRGSIRHSSKLYITNIDNTSDRERINSSVNIKIYNKIDECVTFSFNENISQFYVLASSDKFTSNKTAVEEIKFSNTEYFVKEFINNISEESVICNEKK